MKRERVRALAALAMVIVVGAAPVSTGRQVARAQGVAKGPIVATLQGVSAISPDSAWAVGDQVQTTFGPTSTVIEHWNGTSWTRASSPDPGPSDSVLDGVSSAAPPRSVATSVAMWIPLCRSIGAKQSEVRRGAVRQIPPLLAWCAAQLPRPSSLGTGPCAPA